jgi:hypothetical protein
MPQYYTVGWDYRSSLGVLTAGSVVELEDDFAALVNRDSPGILDPVNDEKKATVEAAKQALADATTSPPADDSDDLDGLNKKQLLALAAERGVDVDKKAKVAVIRAALRDAQPAPAADAPPADDDEEE